MFRFFFRAPSGPGLPRLSVAKCTRATHWGGMKRFAVFLLAVTLLIPNLGAAIGLESLGAKGGLLHHRLRRHFLRRGTLHRAKRRQAGSRHRPWSRGVPRRARRTSRGPGRAPGRLVPRTQNPVCQRDERLGLCFMVPCSMFQVPRSCFRNRNRSPNPATRHR